MTGRSSRLFVASLAIAALATACGDPSAGPAVTGSSDTTPGTNASVTALAGALEGRTFLSTEVTDTSLVTGTRVALTANTSDGESPRLSLSAGCNSMSGPFRVTDGRLVMDSVSTTEMGCGPALHAQDEMFRELLFERPTIALDGDTLVITGDTITLTLVDQEVADPDRPLLGTTWTINTIITEMWASTTPAAATLLFEDADVTVDTGCNTGSAPITIDGTTITFGTLTLTEIACGEELMAFEAHIAATLSGSRTIEITASSLTLLDPASGAGVGAHGG